MKKGAIIGIVCGVAAVGVAAIGVSAALILNSPTVKVVKGATHFLSELGGYNSGVSERTGMDEVQYVGDDGSYQSTFDVDIYDLEDMDDLSLKLDGSVQYDYTNEKIKEEASVSISYYELLSFQLAVDGTDVYLDIPELYDGSICFDSQNIDEQIKNSFWAEYLDEEITEEISMDLFDNAAVATGNFYETYKKEFDHVIRNADIEKYEGVLSIEVGGKEKECQGYLVTLKKEDINSLIETMYGTNDKEDEDNKESKSDATTSYLLKDDVKLLVYMDKDNNIRQFQTEEDITVEGIDDASFSVALRFTGEDSIFDTVKGKIGINSDEGVVTAKFDYGVVIDGNEVKEKIQLKATADGVDELGLNLEPAWNMEDNNYTMDMDMNIEDENFTLAMAGFMGTDASSNSYNLNLNDCAIYYEDELVGSFDVNYCMEPLTEEISMPTGKTYPIFEMTENEFYTFVLESYEKIESYVEMFEGLEDFY